MRIKPLEGLPFLGESKEKKTLAKIKDHLKKTEEAVKVLEKAIEAFPGEEQALHERVNEVDMLEKEADMMRRSIEEDLYSGAFLPISRSRILDFAENVDKIADAAEDAAKILTFADKEKVPDELLELLKESTIKAKESIELLEAGIEKIEDLEAVKKILEDIRFKEHESDEISDKAFRVLYKNNPDAKTLHILAKTIEFVGNISDTAEDASDSLSLIVLMHKI